MLDRNVKKIKIMDVVWMKMFYIFEGALQTKIRDKEINGKRTNPVIGMNMTTVGQIN